MYKENHIIIKPMLLTKLYQLFIFTVELLIPFLFIFVPMLYVNNYLAPGEYIILYNILNSLYLIIIIMNRVFYRKVENKLNLFSKLKIYLKLLSNNIVFYIKFFIFNFYIVIIIRYIF